MPRFMASLMIEPTTPQTYGVRIVDRDHVTEPEVVVKGESYTIASRIVDATNHKLGHIGVLATMGRMVDGECGEIALRLTTMLEDRVRAEELERQQKMEAQMRAEGV